MSSCPHHTSCRSPGPQVSYSLCQALTFMGYYPPFRIFNERNHHLPFCHDNVVVPRGHKIRNTVIWFSGHIKKMSFVFEQGSVTPPFTFIFIVSLLKAVMNSIGSCTL